MTVETASILVEASRRLFGDLCTTPALINAERQWPSAMWAAIAAAGYPVALLPDASGGAGVALGEGLSILRSAGEFGLPLPLTETMLASVVLFDAGIAVPEGPTAFAVISDHSGLSLRKDGSSWRLTGTARRVPGARYASHVVLCLPDSGRSRIAVAAIGAGQLRPDENLAREPRDELAFDVVLPPDCVGDIDRSIEQFQALGAAARCCQMAGALDRVLEITVDYAKTRIQFGRPLGKFQAVQQNLAVLAAQVAAAGVAADMAMDTAVDNDLSMQRVAAAKIRIGEAAGLAAGIGHQVHGAFGFTYEHNLHLFTKRLLAWREEFGNERYWSRWLGDRMLQGGADALWPAIVAL